MNRICLVGRLGKDPEMRQTQNGVTNCTFPLAVYRARKDANGERQTDWFNVVCWRATADFVGKYFHKSDRIGIVGTVQNRSYVAQDGSKRFITEVIAEAVEFVESNGGGSKADSKPSDSNDDYEPYEGPLPF